MNLKTNLAQQWRNWKLNRLRMEIEIQEQMLRLARTEYAALNKLHGNALTLRYGAESAEDLTPFCEDREQWTKQVEDIFEAALLKGRAA